MTLRMDNDYSLTLGIPLRAECKRRQIDFEMSDLNKQGWGDVLFTGLAGTYSGEVKGAGEFIGNMDHAESQLFKQIANCDRPFLAIYGRLEQAEDGGCEVLSPSGGYVVTQKYRVGADSGISRSYRRHHYRQLYTGYRGKLARLSEEGVQVFEVPDLASLAVQLCALYSVANSEGKTFSRLIPEKYFVREEDKARKDFMLTLMGIQGAGVGEEVADAIATFFSMKGWGLTLSQLCWEDEMLFWWDELATQKLRSGKRTIGPAAVKKLKEALGVI